MNFIWVCIMWYWSEWWQNLRFPFRISFYSKTLSLASKCSVMSAFRKMFSEPCEIASDVIYLPALKRWQMITKPDWINLTRKECGNVTWFEGDFLFQNKSGFHGSVLLFEEESSNWIDGDRKLKVRIIKIDY